MKKYKIIITIFVLFIIAILVTYYEYQSYSHLANEFVYKTVALIKNNYSDVDDTKIIEIINENDYEATSDVLTSYGFTNKDLSILASFEKNFYEQLLLNIILFIIIIAIILLISYYNNLKKVKELNNLIKYLKELNRGNYDLQIDLNSEGTLSKLKNEIYTTTIMLKEQAERELEDKKNLKDSLTNISHQLKTPLTSISLLVDNLSDKNIPPNIREEFLNDIKSQIESINYLVIVLLKLSRFEANVVTFKKEPINVQKILLNIYKYVDAIRELKNINIHITGSPSVTFTGDYKWEFEALSNILKNSIEYTPENKNIYINFKETNLYTEIYIQDEGQGMTKEEKKRIFEKFFKGNNNSNNFGIGLSLAKEIITKDNGTIKVESELNVGTSFKIRYYK